MTKVHQEAKRFARDDFDILLIGHRGHEEVEGTAGEAPAHIQLVDGADDVANVQVRDPEKVVWLSQTTLSVDETLATVDQLKNRFPGLQAPPSDDICYATQNRQQAVKQMAAECDLVLVVGSTNSSNSVRLVEVALEAGARDSHLVDFASEIDAAWLEGVGTVGRHQRRLGAGDPGQRGARLAGRARLRRRGDGQGRRGAAGVRAAARAAAAPRRRAGRRRPTTGRRRRRPATGRATSGRSSAAVRAGGSAAGDQPDERERRAATPVAMAMVGKPRIEQGGDRRQVERRRRGQGDVERGDGEEDQRRRDDDGEHVAAADQRAWPARWRPTRATRVIMPRPMPMKESAAAPARVTRKMPSTATAPRTGCRRRCRARRSARTARAGGPCVDRPGGAGRAPLGRAPGSAGRSVGGALRSGRSDSRRGGSRAAAVDVASGAGPRGGRGGGTGRATGASAAAGVAWLVPHGACATRRTTGRGSPRSCRHASAVLAVAMAHLRRPPRSGPGGRPSLATVATWRQPDGGGRAESRRQPCRLGDIGSERWDERVSTWRR